jgi:NMD protein affecting ribosome stability and mRNA decay
MTATIKPPDRSREQRRLALIKANEIRHERAVLKRDIRAGRQKLAPLLLNPPSYLETAKIIEFVLAVPRIGPLKANRILSRSRVSPGRTFRGASPHQRRTIVAELRPMVCPRCDQSFMDLRRHMALKHRDYVWSPEGR